MTINLNDYVDRLPMAFRTRGGKRVIVEYKTSNTETEYRYRGYYDVQVDDSTITGVFEKWTQEGRTLKDTTSIFDIISEWQDEPVKLKATDAPDGFVLPNLHEDVRKYELTPELLEDIKAGAKAWRVLESLSKGGSYPDSDNLRSMVWEAMQQINSEDK